MKLFLSSAGLQPETTEKFLKLLGKSPKETRVCFIATASKPEEDKWYIDQDKKRLSELGFGYEELDLEEENEKSLDKKLKNFDVIFVEGGNTFYLLKYAKKSGFGNTLKRFLDNGGVYLGVSAGTIIMGKNIKSSQIYYDLAGQGDKNIVDLKDLTGLDFVPYIFCVHINKKDINIIKDYATETSYPIVCLSDSQALLVNGKDIEIVGSGEKYVFNTKTRTHHF